MERRDREENEGWRVEGRRVGGASVGCPLLKLLSNWYTTIPTMYLAWYLESSVQEDVNYSRCLLCGGKGDS